MNKFGVLPNLYVLKYFGLSARPLNSNDAA